LGFGGKILVPAVIALHAGLLQERRPRCDHFVLAVIPAFVVAVIPANAGIQALK
jgi:hypothetical protein